jgi:hypothetical protein
LVTQAVRSEYAENNMAARRRLGIIGKLFFQIRLLKKFAD